MIEAKVEVTRVSGRGIWVQAHDRKFFLSYFDFPWFKDKPMLAVMHVEECSPGEFYWPLLDINLSLDTLQSPHRFPPQQRAQAGA